MEDVRKFQFTKRFSDNPCILEKIKEVITDYTLFCFLACMPQIELNKKKIAYLKIQMTEKSRPHISAPLLPIKKGL